MGNEPEPMWTEYDPQEMADSADREVLAMVLWPVALIFVGSVVYFVGRAAAWW
jgi:hypothetical protein